jgi:hypothetical protein
MSKGVYIHGTNGAGKTTLARCLMICAMPGVIVEAQVHDAPVTIVSARKRRGWDGTTPVWVDHMLKDLVFIGKYKSATGGFDTVQPYAEGVKAAITRARDWDEPIVMESLMTPGVDTCKQLAEGIGDVTFFWLDTPLAQCIEQTNKRRAARDRAALEDVSNIERKAVSVGSWARRLHEAGLCVERGDWDFVYARCKQILSLEPSEEHLLS